MKNILIVAVGIVLLAAPTVAQTSDTNFEPPDPEADTTGNIQAGVWNSDISGNPEIVAPYSPADKTGALVLFTLKSHKEWGDVDAGVQWLDENDTRSFLNFDIGRTLLTRTTYRRFTPRLGHDPLTYAEAVTAHDRVLRHTDTDPDAVYGYENGILEHRSELQLGVASVGFNFRDQRREGAHQGLIVSHCDNCHVSGVTRPIDESQQDIGLDAKVAWTKGFLEGSYTRRKLRQDVTSIDFLYDRARHPASGLPIFDNRVQFDSLDGLLPVDVRPDTDKDIIKVNLQQAAGAFSLTGNGVWSNTENLYTSNESDYQGYFFSAARPFAGKRARVRFRGRYYETDTGDYFFDTVEREGVAGPHAGKTYRDVYGIDVDYNRQSSLNRKVWDLDADVTFKLGRKAGRLAATWNFKDINREYYQVAPGETKTTTNILGLQWRPRPGRGLRFNLGYRHAWVDNPYNLVGGACSDQVTEGPLASPFDPRAAPYYTMRDAKIMDTTASAGSWDEIKLRGSYSKGRTMVTGLYRYWNGTNTSGNLTDWDRTNQTGTVTFAWMPAPTWDGFVSYNYQKLENSAPGCIAIFDG
ncbi:MAG: hypothetical protein LJF30_07400 [Acidobacteria bacterium]|nr:hypothetical protein [Acidobacteriota bacterium]